MPLLNFLPDALIFVEKLVFSFPGALNEEKQTIIVVIKSPHSPAIHNVMISSFGILVFSEFIIQRIVTLPKHGHGALDIRNFVSRGGK